MSTQTSSGAARISRFDRFEQDQRAEATAARHPLRRLDIAPVVFAHTANADPEFSVSYTLISRRGGNLRMADLSQESPAWEPFDAGVVADRLAPVATRETENKKRWLCSPGGVVIVGDRSTANYLMRKAQGSAGHQRLDRSLQLCDSLPASTRFVVLTEALERGYYPQNGVDAASLAAWARAFGLTRPTSGKTMLTLALKVYSGTGGNGHRDSSLPIDAPPALLSAMKNMARSESNMVRYAGASGLASDCSNFTSAAQIAGQWEFLNAADLLGRERAKLDGTVFTLVDTGGRKARIEGVCKARPGKKLLILDPQGWTRHFDRQSSSSGLSARKVHLEEVQMDVAGDRVAVLGGPLPREDGRTVQAMQAPFLPGFTGRSGARWTASPGRDGAVVPTWREVPLHVSLAGAPREGTAA